jgi:hypothetical protein
MVLAAIENWCWAHTREHTHLGDENYDELETGAVNANQSRLRQGAFK